MNAILVASALALLLQQPAEETKPGTKPGATPAGSAQDAKIDGNWKVICLEKNGSPVADAKDSTVTVQGNTIRVAGKDGKQPMTLTLDFADQGKIRVTESNKGEGANPGAQPANDRGQAKQGVYVLTQDFLAICLHDDKAGAAQPAQQPAQAGATASSAQPTAKSYMSIILKREGGNPSSQK